MQLRIETLLQKKLIGKHLTMSLANDRTFELWRSFMPRRKEIKNNVNANLFSLQVYPPSFDFKHFDPTASFEKWAAIEVTHVDVIPNEMESISLEGGLYAVFLHKGAAATAPETFRYIFETWFPSSGYQLDNRPHFEVLGERYKNDDPSSEEDIYIPIRLCS